MSIRCCYSFDLANQLNYLFTIMTIKGNSTMSRSVSFYCRSETVMTAGMATRLGKSMRTFS